MFIGQSPQPRRHYLQFVYRFLQMIISRNYFTGSYWSERGIGCGRDSVVPDLNSTALGFRILRLHRYSISSGIYIQILLINHTLNFFMPAAKLLSRFISNMHFFVFKVSQGSYVVSFLIVNRIIHLISDVFKVFEDQNRPFACFPSPTEGEIRSIINLYRASLTSFPGETNMEMVEISSKRYLNEALQKLPVSRLSQEVSSSTSRGANADAVSQLFEYVVGLYAPLSNFNYVACR